MSNQPPKASGHTTRTKCEKVFYCIAFGILFLAALVLVTSTTWESNAPLLEAILKERGALLGVASATGLLLSLLLGWNPGGWPMLATIFSGVLGFAAAAFNLDLVDADDLPMGLALLFLASPLVIITLPMLRRPRGIADSILMVWMWPISFMYMTILTIQFIILGVPSVTQWAVEEKVLGSRIVWIMPMVPLALIIAVIIGVQSMIRSTVPKIARLAWTRKVRCWIHRRRRKQPPRGERRRSRRRNR